MKNHEEELTQEQISAIADSLKNIGSPIERQALDDNLPGELSKMIDKAFPINEVKMLKATTTKDTKHGPGYASVTIPAGTKVTVNKAINLPSTSKIDYWLYSVDSMPQSTMKDKQTINRIKSIRDGQGIGFEESDLKF